MLWAYSAVELHNWIALEIKTYLVGYFLTNWEFENIFSKCLHAISNCKHVSFITFYKLSGSIIEALQGFVQYRIWKQLFLNYRLNYTYTTVDILGKHCAGLCCVLVELHWSKWKHVLSYIFWQNARNEKISYRIVEWFNCKFTSKTRYSDRSLQD